RPMQISTRVGVVQAMALPPHYLCVLPRAGHQMIVQRMQPCNCNSQIFLAGNRAEPRLEGHRVVFTWNQVIARLRWRVPLASLRAASFRTGCVGSVLLSRGALSGPGAAAGVPDPSPAGAR